ncbi:MAG: hypothetical protein NT166_25975 [Candidatus Aminicenantes bacterium]|nr:hypothetical protein [Candidatus Aminicenantes bacterium]
MDNKIEENALQFNMEATKDAQRITRIAFFVSTIVSFAIILITWNAYFSWYTNFALKEAMPQNDVAKIIHTKAIEQWVDSTNISLPFLGILGVKVWVGDCSIFGSIGLLIIATWFFLSIQREYYVTLSLFEKARKLNQWNSLYKEWIYNGVASYMLFLNFKRKDRSRKRIGKVRRKSRSESIIKKVFKVFLFLPVYSILFLIFSDIFHVFIFPSLFQTSHPSFFEQIGWGDRIRLFSQEVFAILFLTLIIIFCIKIRSYSKRIEKKFREYDKAYREERKNQVRISSLT